jgi:hypothetical protein
VDGAGNALALNGTSWSPPMSIDPTGGPSTTVTADRFSYVSFPFLT